MIEDILIPDSFKAMISAEFGSERAETLLSALNREPETSLRLNRHKSSWSPHYPDMSPVPWCRSGFYLSARPNFTMNPMFHAGAFYVQDASSMIYENIVETLVGNQKVMVCDLCAAPGGKTTAILNAIPDGSVMLANEFSSSRVSVLKENLIKYGYPEIVVTNADTSRLATLRDCFDIVAVDAPCSGEGMMRKEEVARTQWGEGLIRKCTALQREILENAVEMLAPGGYLIYSTCTFNTSEDEDNATWIAESFGLIPVDTGLAGKFGIQPQVKGDIPCLRFIPGFVRGEGLFVCVFKKDVDESCRRGKIKGKVKAKKKEFTDPRILKIAKSWIDCDLEIINHDGHLLALTPSTANLLEAIPKGVRIISAGVEIGEIKGKDLIPAHALAMSVAMTHPFPEVALSDDDAIRFLSRDTVELPPDTPKGYVTVTNQNIPLGFMKNHGNRANNLYPSEYRIKCLIHNS